MKRAIVLLGIIVLIAAFAFADDKPTSGSSDLSFVVLKATNSKPVRNASVIIHPLRKDGSMENGGMQLKTDTDGKTSFRGMPYGKMRIQVIAKGLQTFGEDYEVNQPTHEITIKLDAPKEQFSIYKDNPGAPEKK